MPTPESSPATHCGHCGAAVRSPNATFCEYCGTKLPERQHAAAEVVVASPFGDLPARFAALREHPERAQLARVKPDLKRHALGMGFQVVFFVVFVGIAGTIAAGACTMGGIASRSGVPGGSVGGGAFALVPMLMAAFGVFALVAVLRKSARFAAAPLVRADACWVDERTEVSGGGDDSRARTAYYATLEDAHGDRREYEVEGKVTGRCKPGDMGIAFLKGDVLVDFRRIPV